MIRWMQIDRDVVALYGSEKNGKVTLGKLLVMPIGIWNKLTKTEQK